MNTKQLRQSIKKLPPLPKSERFTWTFNRQDLRNNILENDPEQFLTWPIIKQTMFVGNAPYITKELKNLDNKYRQCITSTPWDFGRPQTMEYRFYDRRCITTDTCGNYIHQAYHLMTWEQSTKLNIKDLNTIVEFGGGYGAMCLICRRLGFKGDYIIVDFPEFNLLQGYYLSNTIGIENTYFIRANGKFPVQTDLMIANCSLSEAPIKTRDEFISSLNFKHHLVSYQPMWDGIDNIEYFDSRFQMGTKINIEHLGHWYSVQ